MGYLGAQSGEFLAVRGETPIAAFVNDAKIHNVRLREVKRWPKVTQIPCRNVGICSKGVHASTGHAAECVGLLWGGGTKGREPGTGLLSQPAPKAKGQRRQEMGAGHLSAQQRGTQSLKYQSWATQSPLVFLSQHRQDGKPSGLGGPGHLLST